MSSSLGAPLADGAGKQQPSPSTDGKPAKVNPYKAAPLLKAVHPAPLQMYDPPSVGAASCMPPKQPLKPRAMSLPLLPPIEAVPPPSSSASTLPAVAAPVAASASPAATTSREPPPQQQQQRVVAPRGDSEEDIKEYLRQLGVASLFDAMTNDLLLVQPHDAVGFMIDWLSGQRDAP